MRRTLPTYNMLFLQELDKNERERFRRALRKDDQKMFDEVFLAPKLQMQTGATREDYEGLATEISRQTGLSIVVEGM